VIANADGTFNIDVPPQTYMVIAQPMASSGAQGNFTGCPWKCAHITEINLPAAILIITSVIDQLDAMTIGMNYNATVPAAADLTMTALSMCLIWNCWLAIIA